METHHTKDSWWRKRLYFTPRKSVQELFTESLYGEQHSSTALLRKPLLEVRMVTKPMAAVLVTSCKDVNPALLNQSPFLSQVPRKIPEHPLWFSLVNWIWKVSLFVLNSSCSHFILTAVFDHPLLRAAGYYFCTHWRRNTSPLAPLREPGLIV